MKAPELPPIEWEAPNDGDLLAFEVALLNKPNTNQEPHQKPVATKELAWQEIVASDWLL